MGSNKKRFDFASINPWRVLVKAVVLFILMNLAFVVVDPPIGKFTLYNWLLPGRERFPQGSKPEEFYNFAIFNLDGMFASHIISRPKASDEFRVFVIGDSSVWGVYLRPEETLAGRLSSAHINTCNHKSIVVYNLGYSGITVAKDMLILDYAMKYQPDMVIWVVSLDGFTQELQKDRPFLLENYYQVQELNKKYGLSIDIGGPDGSILTKTIFGQRRELADLVRIQLYGVLWGGTGIDEDYKKKKVTLPISGYGSDVTFAGQIPPTLDRNQLLLDVMDAGKLAVGKTPLLIVNEPIFITPNYENELFYNEAYPRWAYDQFRQIMAEESKNRGWDYVDLWNIIPPEEFTDTVFHLTKRGEYLLAKSLLPHIIDKTCP
jgi:hypothetical protein